MPIKGATYGVTKSKVRLAFKGGKVVEAKSLKSGKVHTPKEFAADRTKVKKNKNN